MGEREHMDPTEHEPATPRGGMREGLDREYESMGTGEAGGGVGGGGASSSDVEWEDGSTDEED